MKRVDVTGEICPRPALIVRRELSGMEPGEELLVQGDYPPAERNLQRTCTKHGYEVTAVDDEDASETFELRITLPETASDSEAERR
ncbi:sulfurtransferase TusA family protein [Halorussus salinisoli]|uniref:sulfurtransferase TusA family protein n=1 Tax=Halorussus salinisoli TaxID=2558242 RepID=UPI0010C17456|nr:sulfurtransferase TusA family protein [Halorussus salinisoli]